MTMRGEAGGLTLMHLLSKRALIRMKLLNLGNVINYFASDIDMDSE